jgi:hypothetical protein
MLAPRGTLFARAVLLELLRLSWRRRRREAPTATCAST